MLLSSTGGIISQSFSRWECSVALSVFADKVQDGR